MNRSLKARLHGGDAAIGSWIQLGHPGIAEILARAGFDWLALDLEHSTMTLDRAEELIRVIELAGVVPLVRLSSNDAVQVKRVMDAGAHGVIVPMVNSREDAERAVAAVRYPPAGTRSVGLSRAQGYGARFDEYCAWLQRDSVVVVQIEHTDAIARLDDILSTDGIDAFIVGPYDLSGSLGCPGDFSHPSMRDALAAIQAAARRHRVAAGMHVVQPRPAELTKALADGYLFVAFSVDTLILGDSARTAVRAARPGLVGG